MVTPRTVKDTGLLLGQLVRVAIISGADLDMTVACARLTRDKSHSAPGLSRYVSSIRNIRRDILILVTGATGFVGRRLVYRLTREAGVQIRVLLRPGSDVSRLPRPLTVHTMMGDITDMDSLLAAMSGVHTVIHLVSTESRGRRAQLAEVDVAGARSVVEAALAARVGRIVFISRPGADRVSAFPVLRAKGEIEDLIRSSGLAYTIVRSATLFGEGDHFSEHIAMLCSSFPVYLVPGDGETVFQPLWVEDLVTCLMMTLEDLDSIDAVLSLGGPELLSYRRTVMRVMHTIGSPRPIIGLPLLLIQLEVWFLDGLFSRWPLTQHWIEMFSSSQTAELGTVERHFGFRPAAFDVGALQQYMRRHTYVFRLLRHIFTAR